LIATAIRSIRVITENIKDYADRAVGPDGERPLFVFYKQKSLAKVPRRSAARFALWLQAVTAEFWGF
jgi:hypothetical protein